MNHLVLSGTATLVPSGTRSSCYRGPESGKKFSSSTACRARNFPNPESFGFFLTDRPFSTTEDKQRSVARNATVRVLSNLIAVRKTAPAPQRPEFSAQQFSSEGAIA